MVAKKMILIRNFKGWLASLVFLLIFLVVKIFGFKNAEVPYQHNEGVIFSTVYHFTYKSDKDLHDTLLYTLNRFDATVSPFNSASQISAFNNNDTCVIADKWLVTLICRSLDIWKATNGAFDPTVSPLINMWGFGYKEGLMPDGKAVDSAKRYVGMDKVYLAGNNKISKSMPEVSLNFSAIAKGYSVDIVADLLKSLGVNDFLVEIGGEILCSGENADAEAWHIGIDKPNVSENGHEIQTVLYATDIAMATSGNYRNYRVVNGKRVGHTIDPRTGYPAENSMLSVTVIAPDCMTADAYATAFMVLGLEESKRLVDSISGMDAMFIYSVDTSTNAVYMTDGVKKLLKNEQTRGYKD